MLGISVYLANDQTSFQTSYIRKMREQGFTSLFTSLHIPEDDPSVYKEKLQELGKLAQKYDMELIADISPASLQYLGYRLDNAPDLLTWGVKGLRIDEGMDEQTIAHLSQNMKIVLNASTITREALTKMQKAGVRLSATEAWHNFYPRPETGLDFQAMKEKNKWLKEQGLIVMAFIPGDEKLRGPLFQGLPTVEAHREISPFAAYMHLQQEGCVDKVVVGDISIKESTIQQFATMQKGKVFLLRARARTKNQLLLQSLRIPQTNRLDVARDCLRSVESRACRRYSEQTISPTNTIERPKGTITIDNEKYGRYQGEIQVTKRDLPADSKVNVIGNVIAEDLPLLSFIHGGDRFKVKWI